MGSDSQAPFLGTDENRKSRKTVVYEKAKCKSNFGRSPAGLVKSLPLMLL